MRSGECGSEQKLLWLAFLSSLQPNSWHIKNTNFQSRSREVILLNKILVVHPIEFQRFIWCVSEPMKPRETAYWQCFGSYIEELNLKLRREVCLLHSGIKTGLIYFLSEIAQTLILIQIQFERIRCFYLF